MSEQLWYYIDSSDEQVGPITIPQIQVLVMAEVVTHRTIVWTEALGDQWIPACNVIGLFDEVTPPKPDPNTASIKIKAPKNASDSAALANELATASAPPKNGLMPPQIANPRAMTSNPVKSEAPAKMEHSSASDPVPSPAKIDKPITVAPPITEAFQPRSPHALRAQAKKNGKPTLPKIDNSMSTQEVSPKPAVIFGAKADVTHGTMIHPASVQHTKPTEALNNLPAMDGVSSPHATAPMQSDDLSSMNSVTPTRLTTKKKGTSIVGVVLLVIGLIVGGIGIADLLKDSNNENANILMASGGLVIFVGVVFLFRNKSKAVPSSEPLNTTTSQMSQPSLTVEAYKEVTPEEQAPLEQAINSSMSAAVRTPMTVQPQTLAKNGEPTNPLLRSGNTHNEKSMLQTGKPSQG